jgi:G3E family GTPase
MNDPSVLPPRADVYLLTGFLGSGKTTLLRNMLRWETDLSGTVVLVNEFGKVGVDGDILRKSGSDVVELTSGCVCCTLKGELVQALKEISARFKPRRIIIEATGVAQPESMAAILSSPELTDRMVVKGTVTVLDIKLWLARESLGDFFWMQLNQARLILLNKIDRVPPESVSAVIEELRCQFPGCRVIPTRYCQIDPEVLWSDSSEGRPGPELKQFYAKLGETNTACIKGALRPSALGVLPMETPRSGPGFITFDFFEEKPLSEPCFKKFLQQAPVGLFRIKGPVRFSDRTALINFAGGSGDWEDWNDDGCTRLVFVGWMIEPTMILQNLKACVQTSA